MLIIGGILLVLGAVMSFVYSIILLVKAFQESIIWGLVYLFVPFGALVFIITNWNKAGKPFLMNVLSIVIAVIGMLMISYAGGS